MDCCTYTQEADAQFGETRAAQDAREYEKRGLNRDARAILELVGKSAKDASLLEVGGGIGAVTLELLKRGATRATNIEASSAYLHTARALAEQAGLGSRVVYHSADFTREAGQIAPADIVIMHRVVCCYPDAHALVTAAAQHTVHLLALSYPVDRWYMRLFTRIQNFIRQIRGSGFRMYIHKPRTVFESASVSGLKPVRESSSGIWRMVVFERIATA